MAVIQLTSPLILANDPTLALHPVTKRYADGKISALDAWGFTSGVLNVARIPEFLGDVTKPAGAGNVTLTPTGVVAGTYTKITVSPSGRVISGGPLTPADIPAMNWTKITSGKPNTLAGYGITDALTAAGGIVTGDMSLTATPVNNYHMVNKSYVDVSIVPGGDSIVVGDITRMAITSTPTGFLRANGGKVSKTTYAALYAMIGDRYETLLNMDTATMWRHHAGVKLGGEIVGGIKTVAFPPGGTYEQSNYNSNRTACVIKNKLYVSVVGTNGGYVVPGLVRADILPNGDVTNPVFQYYGTASGFPIPGGFFVIKNYLWFNTGSYTSNQDCVLRRAFINSDGTLGPVNIVFSDPNKLMYWTKFVLIKDRLYVFDYWFSPYTGNMDVPAEYGYFSINSSGDIVNLTSLGSFYTGVTRGSSGGNATQGGPILDAFVMKEKLIVLSGNTSGELSTYYATINSDGSLGAWTKGVSLASATNVISQAVTTTNGTYIFYNSDAVYRLNFDATGTPVSWTFIQVGNFHTFQYSYLVFPVVVKNRIYVSPRFSTGGSTAAYLDFTGGANDYTQYTDGSLSEKDPLNFFLPDFTSKETAGNKYFIKT